MYFNVNDFLVKYLSVAYSKIIKLFLIFLQIRYFLFSRDFAYVARDRLTRIHMCHVFRCDTAARIIANTLR